MTARLLRFTVFSLWAFAGLWVWWWLSQGAAALAVGGALLILLFHVPTLAAEFVLMHRSNRSDPAPRANLRDLVSAWWAESWLGLKIFAWQQPFLATSVTDHLPSTARGKRGVVLVHGFMCNRGMWNGWLKRLKARDIPCIAVNLEPTFGSIDSYGGAIDDAVQRMQAATGQAPVIVAHSMGGLATRAWLRSVAKARSTAGPLPVLPVHRVITLGSPHAGTAIGLHNPAANVVQMRLNSPWVQALAKSETAELQRRFICFYSACDNIVFPASTATLNHADNRHIAATAHMQLITRLEVFDALLGEVAEAMAIAQPPSALNATAPV